MTKKWVYLNNYTLRFKGRIFNLCVPPLAAKAGSIHSNEQSHTVRSCVYVEAHRHGGTRVLDQLFDHSHKSGVRAGGRCQGFFRAPLKRKTFPRRPFPPRFSLRPSNCKRSGKPSGPDYCDRNESRNKRQIIQYPKYFTLIIKWGQDNNVATWFNIVHDPIFFLNFHKSPG